MKKTLIALAAVAAATGAMAQATISGTLDVRGVANSKVETQAASSNTVVTNKTKPVANNGWSTSELRFSGTEDLGGGLKASFQLNTGLANGASTLADRDRWLQLAGGFGTVRIGRFTPATNQVVAFNGTGTTNTAGSLEGLIHAGEAGHARQTNIQYTTPSFNGFTAAVVYAGGQTADFDNLNGKAATDLTGLNLAYASGPLRVGAGMSKKVTNVEAANAVTSTCTVANNNSTSGTTTVSPNGCTLGSLAVTNAKTTSDMNYVGASYDLGVAVISAVHTNRKNKTSTAGAAAVTGTDITVNGLGVAVPMGAITLRASYYTGKDKQGTGATNDLKLSGNQLSATYALSKRTLVYAVTGKEQSKRDGAASTAATSKTTQTNIGLSHSF